MWSVVKELFVIVVTVSLINNVVLSQFLGICPFLGVSKSIQTASGMGGAVIFVITLASFVTGIVYKCILAPEGLFAPDGLEYLQTIVFILVIAALVQFVEMFLKKSMPPLYNALGVYLPLITTNCAVLGVALTNVQNKDSIAAPIMEACGDFWGFILAGTISGFGTAFGFFISIVLMAGIREKTEHNDIPEAFRGTPIVLVTACLMSIAFIGISGLKIGG